MERTTKPNYILCIARGHDNTFTLNLVKRNDSVTPLYRVSHNSKMSKMEIRRIKRDAVEPRPVGTVKARSLPPRLEVTVRGVRFKMSCKYPLTNSHGFRFLGAKEMRWEKLSARQGGGLKLVDFNGKVQAHFRPRMHVASLASGSDKGEAGEKDGRSDSSSGDRGEWAPGFELHAAALADLDLDLIVATGLAAAEYRRQLDND